jgi:predicted DNA-binding transcriptional regulator AlpA
VVVIEHEDPGSEQLCVDRAGLGLMLNLSERQIARMDAAGQIPAPLRFGRRSKRWNVEEVKAWIAAGAPPRSRWTAMWRGGK